MKDNGKTIFAGVLISAVCVLATAQGGTLERTAKLVPEETVLLVNVEDFSQLKARFEQTSIYKTTRLAGQLWIPMCYHRAGLVLL